MSTLKTIFLTFPILVIGSLLFSQFVITNSFVGSGKAIDQIEEYIQSLEYENNLLEKQLASVESIGVVRIKADESGFVKPANYLSIASDQLIAFK